MTLLTKHNNESIAVFEANRSIDAQRYGVSSAHELWLLALNAIRNVYTEKELDVMRGQGAYSRLRKWALRAKREFADITVEFRIPGAQYRSRAVVENDPDSGLVLVPLDKIGEVQAYFYDGMLAEKN